MLEGKQLARGEVLARRIIRTAARKGEQITDKQLKVFREELGDEVVDGLIAEQGL